MCLCLCACGTTDSNLFGPTGTGGGASQSSSSVTATTVATSTSITVSAASSSSSSSSSSGVGGSMNDSIHECVLTFIGECESYDSYIAYENGSCATALDTWNCDPDYPLTSMLDSISTICKSQMDINTYTQQLQCAAGSWNGKNQCNIQYSNCCGSIACPTNGTSCGVNCLQLWQSCVSNVNMMFACN